MPTYNLDEDQTLCGSLEFVIDGKKLVVKKLTNKLLDEMEKVDGLSEQLALLCSVDSKETVDLDLRKVGAAIRMILQSITESLGGERFLRFAQKESKRAPKRKTVKNR